ncbi:unnamed protein product [Brassica oleracea]
MLSGGIWRCLCEAFFLVVVINGSGDDLVFAIDLSDDRISVLKAAAVKLLWSCRARGSRCGSSRWLTGTTVTLSLVYSSVSDVGLRPLFDVSVAFWMGFVIWTWPFNK